MAWMKSVCAALPLRGSFREGLGGFGSSFQLANRLRHVHLGALGIVSGGGRDEDAFAGPYRQPAVGTQLEAATAPGTAGGRFGSLVNEMAQSELPGVLAGGETGAQLTGGIVGHPLVEAGFMVVAHPAGEHAGMIGAGFVAG